jgi:hypothetical protein
MEELKMGHEKENIHRRTQTGSLKWHQHKFRKITQILFRLRTGHNRLKAQMARHRCLKKTQTALSAKSQKQLNMPSYTAPPWKWRD